MSQGDLSGDLSGILHAYIAFDWGEEVDLEAARRLIPAEWHYLPRTSRTPVSINYQPMPLRIKLPSAPQPLGVPELATTVAEMDATVFDFAAVSVALHIPFSLPRAELLQMSERLFDAKQFVSAARAAVDPVFHTLFPIIQVPRWSPIGEEYFVFQITPQEGVPLGRELLTEQVLMAGLVRLESDPLSADEITEALRLRLSYGPEDLVIADWAAAVVLDRDCDEILETMAFANLQLLEFREIDTRLDGHLQTAYELIHRLARSKLPFWPRHSRPLRMLGELKVEANAMLDRTTNVLKLMGDPYLARVYRLLASRFHLEAWGQSIQRSLDVLKSVHEVISDQASTYRAESLEVIVVVLILIEIILALIGH